MAMFTNLALHFDQKQLQLALIIDHIYGVFDFKRMRYISTFV
jgi:hypothetical protein